MLKLPEVKFLLAGAGGGESAYTHTVLTPRGFPFSRLVVVVVVVVVVTLRYSNHSIYNCVPVSLSAN